MRTRRVLRLALPALLLGAAAGLPACSGLQRSPAPVAAAPAELAGCAPVALAPSSRFMAQRFDSGLPQNGQWRDGFDLADLNGDGVLDLLHGPPRKGRLLPAIFLGDGSGRFRFWDSAHFPPLPYDYGDAKAGDLNGDGRMDIALASHLRGLVVLINEADGHYAPWGEGLVLRLPAEASEEPVFSSRSIALADWNQDGRLDLLAANEGPSRFAGGLNAGEAMALYLNRDGYWERVSGAQPLHGFGDALAVGDVDGDGRLDAVLGTRVSGARLLWQIGRTNGWVSRELRSLPASATVAAVALRDLDGDGRADLVLGTRAVEHARYCSALHVVQVHAAGESSRTLWRQDSRDPVVAIAIGDIDRDGYDDLLGVRQQGGILGFAGSAKGFRPDLTIPPPTAMAGCSAFDAKLADLDGDGQLELLVSYAGEAGSLGAGCASRGGFGAWRLRAR